MFTTWLCTRPWARYIDGLLEISSITGLVIVGLGWVLFASFVYRACVGEPYDIFEILIYGKVFLGSFVLILGTCGALGLTDVFIDPPTKRAWSISGMWQSRWYWYFIATGTIPTLVCTVWYLVVHDFAN